MQTATHTISAGTSEEAVKQSAFDWQLLLTTVALILCGSFTYSTYSPPVNAAALGIMVALFYYNLHRQDLVSFFIQLFIGNFFIFGNKLGGNYNIAAFVSIVGYTAINGKIPFLRPSALDNSIKTALIIWCVFDLLSVTGGNFFPWFTELQNFFSFCLMLYLFYFVSRIPFTENDFYKFVYAVSIFFGYEFLVAFNQKYEFYNSPFPFFPKTDEAIEFDMGIVRSGSTLNNFEAFAEFCVSLISLLIPGILSGNSLRKNKLFYYFSVFTILIAFMSIIYSGTRSSLILLPLAVAGSCIFLGKKLKAKLVILLMVGLAGVFVLNSTFKFIDISGFQERSEDMDNVTVTSMLNGDAMNRGGLFPYAFKQVQKTTGVIGRGYFVSPYEYLASHFDKGEMNDGIADYHNLYMSSFVLWGPIGFAAMMFLFVYSIFRGWTTYWQLRKNNHFSIDLLLGFNLLFVILMINQFKIQFIRDINYFTLVMLLLVVYISLTSLLRHKALSEKNNHRKKLVRAF